MHHTSSFIHTFVLVVSYLALVSAGLAEESKPNIVLILSDDFGYGSAGCYGADSRLVQTPNIDRLASEGRRFTDVSTPSSVCTPTRYAVLTGRYCWRTHLNHGGVANTLDPLLIETSRPTIASLLKQHGYHTAMVGKWHLGYGTDKRVDYTQELKPGPLELGFDYQFAVPQNHNDITRVFVENHRVYGLRSANLSPAPGKLGLDAPERDDPRTMHELTERAVTWLEQQPSTAPFFLYFAPVAVHELVTPSAETSGTSAAGPYGDFIHDLDLSVGRILDTLQRIDAVENTLVIFTSDNGGVVAEKSKSNSQQQAMEAGLKINGSLRGGKHDVWEGGFRVPFIARWPGHIPAGSSSQQMLGVVDVFATLAAIVGEPQLDRPTTAPDSVSMLPAMTGQPERPLRDDLLFQSAAGVYAIRSGPWKWVEGIPLAPPGKKPPGKQSPKADQFQPQLFNLVDDPEELHDVAAAHPRVVARLSTSLQRQRSQGYTSASSRPQATNAFFDPVQRETDGWTVHIDPALLDGPHREEGTRALEMLANHLQRIQIVVPSPALEKLKRIEIWIEHSHPSLKAMQYHPNRQWLVEHGHDPRLAKKVHITQAHELLSRQQMLKHPAVVLHELAHGYHDQILSFDQPDIIAAYERAKVAGIYRDVLLFTGDRVEHYGLNNHKEYFAEGTEAYFYRNDFFPFVRAELKEFDPTLHDLLEQVWETAQ